MKKLKVLLIGTQEELQKADGLRDDCHRLKYKVLSKKLVDLIAKFSYNLSLKNTE